MNNEYVKQSSWIAFNLTARIHMLKQKKGIIPPELIYRKENACKVEIEWLRGRKLKLVLAFVKRGKEKRERKKQSQFVKLLSLTSCEKKGFVTAAAIVVVVETNHSSNVNVDSSSSSEQNESRT